MIEALDHEGALGTGLRVAGSSAVLRTMLHVRTSKESADDIRIGNSLLYDSPS